MVMIKAQLSELSGSWDWDRSKSKGKGYLLDGMHGVKGKQCSNKQ